MRKQRAGLEAAGQDRRRNGTFAVRLHVIDSAAKRPMMRGRLIAASSALADPPRRARSAAWLRVPYEHVVFYGLLAIFGLSCLLWSVLAAILYRVLPRRLGEPLGQRVIMAGFRCLIAAMRTTGIIECDLGELDSLARDEPLVIAPNHPSLLDAALVMSRLPNLVCAAKAEIWDNVFLGGSARLAGFVRNDAPARLIGDAVRQVRSGRHFLIFPEGTRSIGDTVGKFKGGFALIAKRAGVPVQTVFIETTSRYLAKGWPLLRKPRFPLVYRVRLGRRMPIDGDVHEIVAELHTYYRQELGEHGP